VTRGLALAGAPAGARSCVEAGATSIDWGLPPCAWEDGSGLDTCWDFDASSLTSSGRRVVKSSTPPTIAINEIAMPPSASARRCDRRGSADAAAAAPPTAIVAAVPK
jgi:hypothetical protein